MAHHLLFVCSGNICRSPMAEGITRTEADRRGFDTIVRSAGTLDLNGRQADKHAISDVLVLHQVTMWSRNWRSSS